MIISTSIVVLGVEHPVAIVTCPAFFIESVVAAPRSLDVDVPRYGHYGHQSEES